MIDGDYFANAAAIGLSPMIGDSVPHKLKKYLGRVGYLVWAIRCFFRFSPFRLSVDDGTRVRRLWSTEVRIRSEEHTSELQSLMRISYAVFCLTKKNFKQTTQNTPTQT